MKHRYSRRRERELERAWFHDEHSFGLLTNAWRLIQPQDLARADGRGACAWVCSTWPRSARLPLSILLRGSGILPRHAAAGAFSTLFQRCFFRLWRRGGNVAVRVHSAAVTLRILSSYPLLTRDYGAVVWTAVSAWRSENSLRGLAARMLFRALYRISPRGYWRPSFMLPAWMRRGGGLLSCASVILAKRKVAVRKTLSARGENSSAWRISHRAAVTSGRTASVPDLLLRRRHLLLRVTRHLLLASGTREARRACENCATAAAAWAGGAEERLCRMPLFAAGGSALARRTPTTRLRTWRRHLRYALPLPSLRRAAAAARCPSGVRVPVFARRHHGRKAGSGSERCRLAASVHAAFWRHLRACCALRLLLAAYRAGVMHGTAVVAAAALLLAFSQQRTVGMPARLAGATSSFPHGNTERRNSVALLAAQACCGCSPGNFSTLSAARLPQAAGLLIWWGGGAASVFLLSYRFGRRKRRDVCSASWLSTPSGILLFTPSRFVAGVRAAVLLGIFPCFRR